MESDIVAELPAELQDKRGEVHIEPKDWRTWLHGTIDEATCLLVPAHAEMFDQSQVKAMDAQLADAEGAGAHTNQEDLF